jgi:hypothetical protein
VVFVSMAAGSWPRRRVDPTRGRKMDGRARRRFGVFLGGIVWWDE